MSATPGRDVLTVYLSYGTKYVFTALADDPNDVVTLNHIEQALLDRTNERVSLSLRLTSAGNGVAHLYLRYVAGVERVTS